jgi:hypothetical protein
MGAVRFLKNINLLVDYSGESVTVPFASGDTHEAKLIQIDDEGFSNIIMPDGSQITGVSIDVFENMGRRVPIERIQAPIEEPEENQEIVVPEPTEEPAVLDGTMLGNDEPEDEYDDYDYGSEV